MLADYKSLCQETSPLESFVRSNGRPVSAPGSPQPLASIPSMLDPEADLFAQILKRLASEEKRHYQLCSSERRGSIISLFNMTADNEPKKDKIKSIQSIFKGGHRQQKSIRSMRMSPRVEQRDIEPVDLTMLPVEGRQSDFCLNSTIPLQRTSPTLPVMSKRFNSLTAISAPHKCFDVSSQSHTAPSSPVLTPRCNTSEWQKDTIKGQFSPKLRRASTCVTSTIAIGSMITPSPNLTLRRPSFQSDGKPSKQRSSSQHFQLLSRSEHSMRDSAYLKSIARSLLYKACLIHEYQMTLRSVLGTPPPLQTGLDTSEDSSEKTDSTTRSHNSPTFMNHQQADMTILDHYLLKPRRAMNKRRMSTTSLRTNHFQQSDLETATAMISMAAEPHFDYPLAQYCYAMCLLQGIGCTADIEKGEMILERAATRNEPMAMFELAAQLERQNDDDDDDGGWLKWMQRAADHPTMPHREACYRLGLFLYQGHCKTPFAHLDGSIQRKGEKHRAAHYFRRAAALGIVLPSMYARWAWKRKYDNKQ